jgi:hypothetical protein
MNYQEYAILRQRRQQCENAHPDIGFEMVHFYFLRVTYDHREWLEDHRRQAEKRQREFDH